MPPAAAPDPIYPVRRVSGTRVLLLMLVGVILLTAGLYTVLTRLKLGGADALKSHRTATPSNEPAR